MGRKIIYIFTKAFPYNAGEDFINNELPFWSENAFETYLLPSYRGNGSVRKIPADIELITNTTAARPTLNKKLWFKNLGLILKILFTEFFHTDKKLFFLKNLRKWNRVLVEAIEDGIYIINHLKSINRNGIEKEVFYSYWMNTWATALAILKDKGEIDNFYFRILGFDIYDSRREGNYMPFRKYIYSQVNKVFPNSQKAVDYVRAKNIYPEKIKLQYLGTNSYGLNPFDPDANLTLISSGKFIPVKRIHLIIEILKNCASEIMWYHFGVVGENELRRLSNLASELPPNIKFKIKGRIEKHEDFAKFFLSTSINIAINVSSSEGLPVTLQEATSYGIPIIATDVGGNAEVANGNGIIIPADFDPKAVAQQIDYFKNSEMNTVAFRAKVRSYWEENFRAETQFERFLKEIS